MRTLWVAELRISEKTAQKLLHKHHVEPAEVRDSVVCRIGLPFRIDDDPQRGKRFVVTVAIRSERWLVVLVPSPRDADIFALATAHRVK